MNTLINQLILTYANYDRPMKRFHMVKVAGSTFRHILQAAKNETIIEAGRLAGSDGPKASILAKSGELTPENALSYLKTMGNYSALFEYSEMIHGGKVSVTLTHDFGPKGSLFLQEYVRSIFEPIGGQLSSRETRTRSSSRSSDNRFEAGKKSDDTFQLQLHAKNTIGSIAPAGPEP